MRFMEATKRDPLKPGYWWQNTAPLGEKPTWKQRPEPHAADDGRLFGYDAAEFLAKQYK